MTEHTILPPHAPMIIAATRLQLGARRGQSQPTQLAQIDLGQWPALDGQQWLCLLDATVAQQPFYAAWQSYRQAHLARWQAGATATADLGSVAQIALWLWIHLLKQHNRSDVTGSLNPMSSTRYECVVPRTDVAPDGIALLDLVVRTLNRAAALTQSPEQSSEHAAFTGYLTQEQSRLNLGTKDWNTLFLRQAAQKHGIPWFNMKSGIDQYGWGRKARRMLSTHTDQTTVLAQQVAKNKARVNELLGDAGLPVPYQGMAQSEAACLALAERIGYPVVVKPATQDFGRGVDVRLTTADELKNAYAQASVYGPVLVESHIEGREYRLTVVAGQLIAAYERIPATVCGDGQRTVRELLNELNADPRRGKFPYGLVRVDMNEETIAVLERQGLTAESIAPAGRVVHLRRLPMITYGATPVDCLAQVHPDNHQLMLRAVRLVGLDIAGVDFIAPDIARSWHEGGAAIIEINSQPGLTAETIADPAHPIHEKILDLMFAGSTGRIPVVALAGAEDLAHLVASMRRHLSRATPRIIAAATCKGAWIGDVLATDRDVSGAAARDVLLVDPAVELALIQLTPAGLTREGHPCDRYAVSLLLGVPACPAMGPTRAQLARVMAEALELASQAVIVNADDPLCLAMLEYAAPKRHILLSSEAHNAAVMAHLGQGGEAVLLTALGVEVVAPNRRWMALSCTEWSMLTVGQEAHEPLALLSTIALAFVVGMDLKNLRHGWSLGELQDGHATLH